MKKAVQVYIGYDGREVDAYEVAEFSLLKTTSIPVSIQPLKIGKLASSGLLRRPQDRRSKSDYPVIYDLISNAPCSTEFAISRFLVPLIAQRGWALFTDCDVVFMRDVAELFALADPKYALMVVNHTETKHVKEKMDGQTQLPYNKKNQSSVCLFNCDHPANARLTIQDVNERKGRDLHQFYWLHENEIGYLPNKWNWLVGLEEPMPDPGIAHFTLGIPSMVGVGSSQHDSIWWNAYNELLKSKGI